jgi:asparagine synthetase B (glutamine-hydrolysing)
VEETVLRSSKRNQLTIKKTSVECDYQELQHFQFKVKHACNALETLIYAKKVAEYIGSEHTEVFFTPQEGIDSIIDVIKMIETYDITTIRASVGQYLLAKYIRKNTDIKIILNGDGADECQMGYLYF